MTVRILPRRLRTRIARIASASALSAAKTPTGIVPFECAISMSMRFSRSSAIGREERVGFAVFKNPYVAGGGGRDATGPVHPDVDVPPSDDLHHAEPVAAHPEVCFGMQLDAVADLKVGQLLAVGGAGHGFTKSFTNTNTCR